MNDKITFPQIVESLASLTGSSISISETFIKELCLLISEALISEKSVKIKHLGTFSRTESTTEPIIFIPDEDIAEAINTPFAFFEAVELNDSISDEIFELESPNITEETEPNISEEDIQPDQSPNLILDDNQETNISDIDACEDSEISNLTSQYVEDSPRLIDSSLSYEESNVESEESEEIITRKNQFGFVGGLLIGFLIGILATYLFMKRCNDHIPSFEETKQEQLIAITDTPKSKIDSITPSNVYMDSTNIIYDTIRPNRYLTTMARQYFGEMNFWVYIYEENKDKLKNPDKISPGTLIRIPPASKYNIDANDSASIERAKIKAIEIYRPYR